MNVEESTYAVARAVERFVASGPDGGRDDCRNFSIRAKVSIRHVAAPLFVFYRDVCDILGIIDQFVHNCSVAVPGNAKNVLDLGLFQIFCDELYSGYFATQTKLLPG